MYNVKHIFLITDSNCQKSDSIKDSLYRNSSSYKNVQSAYNDHG